MITEAETPDRELVHRAQSGSHEATEFLLTRHQPWIFNLAIRMLLCRPDAEDATQEVLIKAFKALPAFRGDCRFRTWLYRIAVNHILNVKKASVSVCSFGDAARGLQQIPDLDLPDPRTVPIPVEILVEETKIGCTMGTLLCLDGRQRLVFILGEIFGVSDEVGAEHLRGNCSLVNPDALCKCAKKTRALIQAGFVDPRKRQFTMEHQRQVREVAGDRTGEMMDVYMKVAAQVYRDHPFYEPAEQAATLREALKTAPLERPA